MKIRGNKEYGAIAFLAICIILLVGKSLGWFQFLSGRAQSSSEASSDNQQVEELYTMQIPDSWQEEIDKNNKIDAKIDVPDSIREQGFKKATASIVMGDTADVLSLFEAYYHPYLGGEDEMDIQYKGEDDLYLYFPIQETYGISANTALQLYINMAYRESPQEENYNRELYQTDVDLEGFTLAECRERLQEICEALKLTGKLSISYRGLDYETMEQEAYELDMDGTVTKPDYQWGVSDNSYYCKISQMCNGIQVIDSYLLKAYADILNYADHTCVLNKERIISLYVNDVYEIQYEDGYEKLLSFSEIMDKYKKSAQLKITGGNTNISDITMRVIAVEQESGRYQMTPIWIFYGSYSSEEETEIPYAIIINGVTGEEIK